MTHEPTHLCRDVHCYSCNVDEPGPGFIVCGECGHLYRTAGELRQAYRRQAWTLHWRWRSNRKRRGWGAAPPPLRKVVWQILTIRAKKITFCQHCIHDF